MVGWGSSPLTRGKPRLVPLGSRGLGLIPAHAGKTGCRRWWRACDAAHPRSRGENEVAVPVTMDGPGSSPLTRGKLRHRRWPRHPPRLIPAHAGKTAPLGLSGPISAAHPRSRGENLSADHPRPGHCGSSPLTRGKHFLTCTFIAQIDQILESLELCASSESYSSQDAYATDALQGRVRSIDLGLRSSRDAS